MMLGTQRLLIILFSGPLPIIFYAKLFRKRIYMNPKQLLVIICSLLCLTSCMMEQPGRTTALEPTSGPAAAVFGNHYLAEDILDLFKLETSSGVVYYDQENSGQELTPDEIKQFTETMKNSSFISREANSMPQMTQSVLYELNYMETIITVKCYVLDDKTYYMFDDQLLKWNNFKSVEILFEFCE